MERVLRSLLLSLFGFGAGLVLHAQRVVDLVGESMGPNVIVEGKLQDDSMTGPLFQAVWRGVPGGNAVFQLQPTAEPSGDVRLMLDRLVEAAVGAYLDARVHFTRQGVHADIPAAQMTLELNAMVSAVIEELAVTTEFHGFTDPTRQQLERLTKIDWTQARFGVDGGDDQDKYLAIYYYVRSQREELERQVRADLLPLASVPLLAAKSDSPGTTVRINSTCGTVFDEQNFLCALDLQLADTGSGGVDPELGQLIMQAMADRSTAAADTPVTTPAKVRKRDRWLKTELDAINERIDRMDQRKELWEMRDRMEDIEDRMSGLELDLQDVKDAASVPTDNPLANLSDLTGRNIAVRFGRNAVHLDPEYRVLLNEVFEQLARAPEERVLITGYTDRSGDPTVNLRLSEQRAKAVRDYLLLRGIGAERLLVNYYGDSRSMGRDPGERRVEIEWLRD